MSSPPKPWERSGATTSAAVPSSATMTTTAASPTTSSHDTPALPAKPDSLSTLASRNASNYSSVYNRSPYSNYSNPYGGMGSSFGSYGYNRFGGGLSGGLGYGGGMYGGMGGYGPGMYQGGMMGPGGQDQSLTQAYTQSTQATFQMIESIVSAFGGFAQMLESTYMATHSSFFAMVSVAEQFGTLKQTLGSVLGIFTLMRWIRAAIAKLTGRPPPASSKELTPANFAAFNGMPAPDGSSPAQPRPSRKPFIFFIVAVFGLPYLMTKLIRALAASSEAEQQRQLANAPYNADGSLHPSELDYCRVLYDYTPQLQPGQQNMIDGLDLVVQKDDLVAVLSKSDPETGHESQWWLCRARDNRRGTKEGYLPASFLEKINKSQPVARISAAAKSNATSPAGSRVNTMTASVATTGGSRANSMKVTEREEVKAELRQLEKAVGKQGGGDMSTIQNFQRAGFYS